MRRVGRLATTSVGTFLAGLCASARNGACLLCDCEYDDWVSHADLACHVARHTVCNAMVVATRHEAMMKQLWEHIQLDFAQIDEVTAKKEAKRRLRLTSSLEHLKARGILADSIPSLDHKPDEEGCEMSKDELRTKLLVAPRFALLVNVGESYATREALDRIMRLLPNAEGLDVHAVMEYCLSPRHLTMLFEMLELSKLLDFKASLLTGDERAAMILAVLGELQLFSTRKRTRSVAEKGAADELVHNVLATHALDNTISELTHFVLQKIVEEGTPVWEEYKSQISTMFLENAKSTPPPLMHSRFPSPEVEVEGAANNRRQIQKDTEALCSLQEHQQPPTASPKIRASIQEMTRASALDLMMPNSPHKNAVLAPCLPRLGGKRKS